MFHLFNVDSSLQKANGMIKRCYDGTSVKPQWIVKSKFRNDEHWFLSEPSQAKKASISEMKIVDLFNKWRPLVPQDCWEESPFFSKRPTIEMLNRVKQMRKKGQEDRQKRKAQAAEDDSNKRVKQT